MIAGGTFGALAHDHGHSVHGFSLSPAPSRGACGRIGGGVVLNQAPHHVDIARLLGGGMVKSVRALTGAWDRTRPVEGAYSALLSFENGAFATLTYSGYAHFDSDEFAGVDRGKRLSQGSGRLWRRAFAASWRANASRGARAQERRNYGGAESPKSAVLPTRHGFISISAS